MTRDPGFPKNSSSNKIKIVHQSSFPKKSFSNNNKKSPPGAAPRQQQRVPLVNCCIFFLKEKSPMKSRSIVVAPYQNGIVRPKKGSANNVRAPRGRTDKTPMSRGRKKSRDDEGSMSRTQKKDRGSANNVTQPQKAAKKPQCLAAAKKPPRRRIDVARPKKGQGNTKQCRAAPKGHGDESPMSRDRKKKTRRQRIDVACPQEGPQQNKTMSHGPKRPCRQNTNVGPQKKTHDDEAGMPRSPRHRRALF